MVRKARVWFDQELGWDVAETDDEGGVAVKTQTDVLTTLSAGEPLFDSSSIESEQEPELTPEPPAKAAPKKEQRHLAGANWLDDWTLYLPTTRPQQRPKPK